MGKTRRCIISHVSGLTYLFSVDRPGVRLIQLHFYYNSRSGLTTWDKPNPLDPPYLPGRFKDRNVPEHFEDRQYVVQPPTRRRAEPPDGGARRWESSHMYGRTRSRKKRLPPLKRTRRYQERKQEEDSPRKVLVLIFPPHDGEHFEAYQACAQFVNAGVLYAVTRRRRLCFGGLIKFCPNVSH